MIAFEEFDQLNLEFWRHEVIKNGVYTPQSFLSKIYFLFYFIYNKKKN